MIFREICISLRKAPIFLRPYCKVALACAIVATGLTAGESKNGWRLERSENRELFAIPRPWTHDFDDQTGPYRWGAVSATCEQGKSQSPIDIVPSQAVGSASAAPIVLNYPKTDLVIENTGHVIEVPYETNAFAMIEGTPYDLLQFHFHTRSEHALNGASYDLEVHFVHRAASGRLAVLGYWIKGCNLLDTTCKSNPVLDEIFANAPELKGEKDTHKELNPFEFLPVLRTSTGGVLENYYSYEGSLTTPPCSEGVRWFVAKDVITVSNESLKKLRSIIGNFPLYKNFQFNYRTPQPLNNREVRSFGSN